MTYSFQTQLPRNSNRPFLTSGCLRSRATPPGLPLEGGGKCPHRGSPWVPPTPIGSPRLVTWTSSSGWWDPGLGPNSEAFGPGAGLSTWALQCLSGPYPPHSRSFPEMWALHTAPGVRPMPCQSPAPHPSSSWGGAVCIPILPSHGCLVPLLLHPGETPLSMTHRHCISPHSTVGQCSRTA